MPRYFFIFGNDRTVAPDLIGQDLPDPEAAKAEAVKLAGDLGMTSAVEGELPGFEWVEVVDEDERPVARFPLARTRREPNRIA